MDDLYHQEILELYKNPQNTGELADYDIKHHEANASCGDAFTFYLKRSGDKKKIVDISFQGEGCAISTAACSLLTSHARTISIHQLRQMDIDDMTKLLGASVTTMRLKCLLLPLAGITKALNQAE